MVDFKTFNTVDECLQRLVTLKCKQYIDIANKTYNISLTCPEILFDLKSTVAGRSDGVKHTISFNNNYLKKYVNLFLLDTVPHEISHILEFNLYGKMSHHKQWKEIMKNLGVRKFERYHHYE